jgi:hypothetical protein
MQTGIRFTEGRHLALGISPIVLEPIDVDASGLSHPSAIVIVDGLVPKLKCSINFERQLLCSDRDLVIPIEQDDVPVIRVE